MTLNSYFEDLRADILPTAAQREDFINGHRLLRERLMADPDLKEVIVTTFLQGSYRRWTAIRPVNGSRPDVDVVVVTRMHPAEFTPQQALDRFHPFLERHYKGKHSQNGRSICIELSRVQLDLVPTAAPSESQLGLLKSASEHPDFDHEYTGGWRFDGTGGAIQPLTGGFKSAGGGAQWKNEPLLIPDRERKLWLPTDPLRQLQWTWSKNGTTNGHFCAIMRIIKWWRKTMATVPDHPKSFPLERIVGECCPDGITTVAEGLTLTLERMVNTYARHRQSGTNPTISDTGIPANDVLARVTVEDFLAFYDLVTQAAKLARRALNAPELVESATLWRELLGSSFPKPPTTAGPFIQPTSPSQPRKADFA